MRNSLFHKGLAPTGAFGTVIGEGADVGPVWRGHCGYGFGNQRSMPKCRCRKAAALRPLPCRRPAAGNDKSKGAAYDARADRRSWEAMKEFFTEIPQ